MASALDPHDDTLGMRRMGAAIWRRGGCRTAAASLRMTRAGLEPATYGLKAYYSERSHSAGYFSLRAFMSSATCSSSFASRAATSSRESPPLAYSTMCAPFPACMAWLRLSSRPANT